MIFFVFSILRKFVINSLYTCPPDLYTVATLLWEIQKVIFNLTEGMLHSSKRWWL